MYQTDYYATGYYSTDYYSRVVAQVGQTLFTYQTLVTEAREQLGDTDPDPAFRRYSDAMLISTMNRGLNELNRIRPDAWYEYYGQYVDNVPEVTDSFVTAPEQVNWEADFQPDIRFYPAIVYYVTGVGKVIDDESVTSGEVQLFDQQFRTLVLNT